MTPRATAYADGSDAQQITYLDAAEEADTQGLAVVPGAPAVLAALRSGTKLEELKGSDLTYSLQAGALQAHLEELAEELGIASKVHFHGFLSQPELMQLYAESHIFLHPSETPPDQNQEGIPNSILEAMSTGLPVAATRHGGIPEAVEHGRGGLLVDERDFEALAARLKEIAQSPHAFREMGLLGSEYVAAHFEQQAQIRQLESYYNEAVALSAAPATAPQRARTRVADSFAEHVSAK